jgi:hypothetical protein
MDIHYDETGAELRALTIEEFPPEILLLIFSILPEVDFPPNPFTLPSPLPDCLAVSQVCRYWRRISHVCPELWTVVPVRLAKWTELALQRSQNLPLALHILPPVPSLDQPAAADGSQVALRSLERVRQVVVGNLRAAYPPSLTQPTLFGYRYPEALMLESVTFLDIHKEFLCMTTPPRLRRLVLVGSIISSVSSLLSASLTELAIIGSSISSSTAPAGNNTPSLIAALTKLPTLRRLIVRAYDDDDKPSRPLGVAAVSLPNLEYFRPVGRLFELQTFLSWLDLPLTTIVDMRLCCMFFEAHQEPMALAALSLHHIRDRLVAPASFTRVRLEKITLEGAYSGHAISFVLDGLVDAGDSVQALRFAFTVQHEAPRDHFGKTSAVPEALHALPLTSRVHTLEVQHPHIPSLRTEAPWVSISEVHPGIEYVRVRGEAAYGFILAVMGHPDSAFCRVRVAEFFNVDFTGDHDALVMACCIHDILEQSGPALRIVLRDCTIDGALAESLIEVFGDRFEWDGIVDAILTETVTVAMALREETGRNYERDYFKYPPELFTV